MRLPRPNVIERWWLTLIYVTVVLCILVMLRWFA
jgi:hypothetical protein